MKKILSLLCISSSILSMQLDRMSPEAKRTLALSFITSRILVEEQPIYNTYDSSDMDDIELEHVPSHLVFAPKALGKVELLHGPEGFSVWKDKKNYAIERYFTDSLVRNMTKRELYSFSKNGYFSINQMEDGNFSLQAQTRVKGGGPVCGYYAYHATRILCWGGITAGVLYKIRSVLPDNPSAADRAKSVANGVVVEYGARVAILETANMVPMAPTAANMPHFESMSYSDLSEYAAKNGMDIVNEQQFIQIKATNEAAKNAAARTSVDISTRAAKKAAKAAAKAATGPKAPGVVSRAVGRALGTTTRNGLPRKVVEKAGTSLVTRITENAAVQAGAKATGGGIAVATGIAAKFTGLFSKTSAGITFTEQVITWAGFAPEAWTATETATVVAEGSSSGGLAGAIETVSIFVGGAVASMPFLP